MNNPQFEWQAGDDQDLGIPSQEAANNRIGKRKWIIVATLLLISVAAVFVIRYFNQQQRQLANDLQKDIIVSFSLWLKAIEEQDDELYSHMLIPGDRSLRRLQRYFFKNDLLLGRSDLGLSRKAGSTSGIEVALDPDWRGATVTFEQSYTTADTAVSNKKVRLQHTAVFDMQDDNWRIASPDEAFWGNWHTVEGDLLIMRYPERDAELSLRIFWQLETDLEKICSLPEEGKTNIHQGCADMMPFTITMDTTAGALDALRSAAGLRLRGGSFQLPALTTVGVPLDEVSYQALYDGYMGGLLENVHALITVPIPFPEQNIYTLCFTHPYIGPKLFKYNPVLRSWTPIMPDRSFRFLEILPDGQGLILDEMRNLGLDTPARIIQWNEGPERILHDILPFWFAHRVIFEKNDPVSKVLLQYNVGNPNKYFYYSLDLQSCVKSGCELSRLPGYAIWSPGGQHTLLQLESQIALGDADGEVQVTFLDDGFNPFWLDDESFAYLRFANLDSGIASELVMNKIGLIGEQILFDSDDLALAAGIDEGQLFMKYAGVNPADPEMILLNVSGTGEYAGAYFIFTVRLPAAGMESSNPDITVHLQRKGTPVGDISRSAPIGLIPFLPSPNGRWLLIGDLHGFDSAKRTFLLHDLQQKQTRIISGDELFAPGQYPSFDWSDDGRWLAISGEGFFRLIAPEEDYEQLVPHEYDFCSFTRWGK